MQETDKQADRLKYFQVHTQLLQTYLEDLKASNIQYTDEGCTTMNTAVEGFVDTSYNPLEQPLVQSFSKSHARELHLGLVLGAYSEFSASLDLGFEESLGVLCDGQAKEFADLLGHCVVW